METTPSAAPRPSRSDIVKYIRFIVVFLAYFSTAKLAQFIFYHFNTSPALLWPPAGIALGFILVWGYDMAWPIALAQFLAAIGGASHPDLFVVATSTVGYTLEALLGARILNKLGFDNLMSRTKDILLFLGIAAVIPALAPFLNSLAVSPAGFSEAIFLNDFTRGWVGGVLSTIIIVPFITIWFSDLTDDDGLHELGVPESVAALVVLIGITYVLFWTVLASAYSFFLIYLFLGILFWIGLRLQPRVMTFALFAATTLGVTGSIMSHTLTSPLSTQLFADELFMILIAPIFLITSVLVTERRTVAFQLQKETTRLAAAMAELEARDASRNDFIGILGHELRNPLSPIANTLEYLRSRENDPEEAEALVEAGRQVTILKRLLDDLLDVTRLTHKKFRIHREDATIDSIVQPALAAIGPFIKLKDQQFTTSSPHKEVTINVDAARITQVITNLLLNASKYTGPGDAIDLSVDHIDDTLVIEVKDSGIGMPQDLISLVFEPFRQMPREREFGFDLVQSTPNGNKFGTGLGLGLFIAKQLIEIHEGTIEVSSAGINQGSLFVIRIPAPARAPKEVTTEAGPHASAGMRPLHVVVVDDNVAAARSFKKLLELLGHHVEAVHTGEDAVRAIQEFNPEVAFVDIGLPDMSGYDVATKVREGDKVVTLVALTGFSQEQDKVRARAAGFDHHLTKPAGLKDIDEILGSI